MVDTRHTEKKQKIDVQYKNLTKHA